MSVLTFHQVTKSFSADAIALRGITLTIRVGEFTAFAGSSGSGKTTALNLAAGLDLPTSGKVTLLGKDLGSLSRLELARLRRENVGFVFQSYNLFPVLTALENVEYPLALKKVDARTRRRLAMEMLAEVGLDGLGKRMPSQLSGGQQQRVAVARAMVTEPKIVFADEPTANVDAANGEKLLLLFRRLNETHKTTFLFSSHDPMVLSIAKRTISMSDGNIVSDSLRILPKGQVAVLGSEPISVLSPRLPESAQLDV